MKKLILVLLALALLPALAGAQGVDSLPRYAGGIFVTGGAPGNGTNCIQTLTIGGTPTGGTFRLAFQGFSTGAITWSATNATLVANVDAALEALPTIGTGGVVTAVGTMTAGIGTITITAGGNLTKLLLPAITVPSNSMTGTSPTAAVAITTAGVTSDCRGAIKAALCVDTVNGVLYQNQGTSLLPSWVKVSSE